MSAVAHCVARSTHEGFMAAENFAFDTVHSSIHFWVRHLMVAKVHGRFTSWSGAVVFDDKNFEAARVELEIDAASVDTKEPQRDAHLRSPDFFDTEKYPKLTFKSTKVVRVDDANFKLTGDLTMHGATHPVTLDVEYAGRAKHPQMGERAGFSARGTLNRKEWGLSWNQVLDAGGLALADKIELVIEIEATKT
jgi:polyisoprenoid-binding protein YceI